MSERRSLFLAGVVWCLLPWLVALDENSYSANQARLASMSPEQLEQLLRRRDSFEMLPPEEQEKLRRLDRELHQEPNAEQLMQTLRGYHEWLKTLRSSEQAKFKDSRPIAERISEISQQISSRRERDIGLTNETRLPPEDNDALRKWAGDFAIGKQQEIAKLFPPGERPAPQGSRRGFQSSVSRLVNSVVGGRIPDDKLEDLVSADDIDRLATALSHKAKQILDDQKSKLEKIRLIFRWINASFMPRISEEELRRFLNDTLDDTQREIIYRLGPDEGRQELIRRYFDSRRRRMPLGPPQNEPGRFPDEPPRGRPDFD